MCTRKPAAILCLMLASTALAGCKALAYPFLMWGQEPTKKVPAESHDLDNHHVAIVVWVDMQTQFEFQFVQVELSQAITNALQGRVKGITLLRYDQVPNMQRRDSKWDTQPPPAIGRKLDVDRVLYVEVGQYTTRDAESSYLLRGRIDANVAVWDSTKPTGERLYQTRIASVFPPEASAEWGNDETLIRRRTMEQFARLLSEKFFDREVKEKKQ